MPPPEHKFVMTPIIKLSIYTHDMVLYIIRYAVLKSMLIKETFLRVQVIFLSLEFCSLIERHKTVGANDCFLLDGFVRCC